MLPFRTLSPLLNRVVIKKAIQETKTKAGIILTTTKSGEQLNYGVVMAVGPGRVLENGTLRPVNVKIGDTVLLPEYGGSKLSLGDKDSEMFVYRDDDIMGVLSDATK